MFDLIDSVVIAGFFSPVADESRMSKARCLGAVLVLASAFLHVKISVKVFRVYLGMVTFFHVCAGGGGVM